MRQLFCKSLLCLWYFSSIFFSFLGSRKSWLRQDSKKPSWRSGLRMGCTVLGILVGAIKWAWWYSLSPASILSLAPDMGCGSLLDCEAIVSVSSLCSVGQTRWRSQYLPMAWCFGRGRGGPLSRSQGEAEVPRQSVAVWKFQGPQGSPLLRELKKGQRVQCWPLGYYFAKKPLLRSSHFFQGHPVSGGESWLCLYEY